MRGPRDLRRARPKPGAPRTPEEIKSTLLPGMGAAGANPSLDDTSCASRSSAPRRAKVTSSSSSAEVANTGTRFAPPEPCTGEGAGTGATKTLRTAAQLAADAVAHAFGVAESSVNQLELAVVDRKFVACCLFPAGLAALGSPRGAGVTVEADRASYLAS